MIQNDTITSKDVIDAINKESSLNLSVKVNKFEKKSTDFLKNKSLKVSPNKVYEFDGKFYTIDLNEIIKPGRKELKEVRGAVTSDYQNELEKLWLKELEQKHPIKVNEEVLYSLGK